MRRDKWGKIYRKWLANGVDYGFAAFKADQSIKKREHLASPNCWCEPELEYVDPETGNEVWLHREPH